MSPPWLVQNINSHIFWPTRRPGQSSSNPASSQCIFRIQTMNFSTMRRSVMIKYLTPPRSKFVLYFLKKPTVIEPPSVDIKELDFVAPSPGGNYASKCQNSKVWVFTFDWNSSLKFPPTFPVDFVRHIRTRPHRGSAGSRISWVKMPRKVKIYIVLSRIKNW